MFGSWFCVSKAFLGCFLWFVQIKIRTHHNTLSWFTNKVTNGSFHITDLPEVRRPLEAMGCHWAGISCHPPFFYLCLRVIGRPAVRRPWRSHIWRSHTATTRGRERLCVFQFFLRNHIAFFQEARGRHPHRTGQNCVESLTAGKGNASSQTYQVSPGHGAGTSFPEDPPVYKILALGRKRWKWMLGRKALCLHYGVPWELGDRSLEFQPYVLSSFRLGPARWE